jgi:hypothetical protein
MPPPSYQRRRSVLLSFRFLGTALIGSLTATLVSIFSPLPAQVAVLGAFVSTLAGLFLSYLQQEDERERRRLGMLEQLRVPVVSYVLASTAPMERISR